VAADLITRWELADPEHPLPGPVTFVGNPALTVESSSLPDVGRHFIDLAVGLKYMLGRDMILATNALLPIQAAGLRPDVLWTLGIQGTFR